jgi:hypothetical protein
MQTAGKIQWFLISSTQGVGVKISSGILTNCCIVGCSGFGILNNTSGSTCTIINCIIYNNGGYGIAGDLHATINVINCISRNNSSTGFYSYPYGSAAMNVSYSNGSRYNTGGNQGCIDQDPNFTLPPSNFHISGGSPSWNTGNPSLNDPDGSQSDMGYFGGTDCPIFPVVTEIIITPATSTINLQAKARANY